MEPRLIALEFDKVFLKAGQHHLEISVFCSTSLTNGRRRRLTVVTGNRPQRSTTDIARDSTSSSTAHLSGLIATLGVSKHPYETSSRNADTKKSTRWHCHPRDRCHVTMGVRIPFSFIRPPSSPQKYEWHPFTISSPPDKPTFTVHIQTQVICFPFSNSDIFCILSFCVWVQRFRKCISNLVTMETNLIMLFNLHPGSRQLDTINERIYDDIWTKRYYLLFMKPSKHIKSLLIISCLAVYSIDLNIIKKNIVYPTQWSSHMAGIMTTSITKGAASFELTSRSTNGVVTQGSKKAIFKKWRNRLETVARPWWCCLWHYNFIGFSSLISVDVRCLQKALPVYLHSSNEFLFFIWILSESPS